MQKYRFMTFLLFYKIYIDTLHNLHREYNRCNTEWKIAGSRKIRLIY